MDAGSTGLGFQAQIKIHPLSGRLGAQLFSIPRLRGRWSSVLVRSERVCAMIRKVRNVEFVVPTVFAVALAIVLSIGAIYLTEILLGPIEPVEAHQSVAGNGGITELPNPDGRLSRVHLLLSGMK
jgi:hypothetical protein